MSSINVGIERSRRSAHDCAIEARSSNVFGCVNSTTSRSFASTCQPSVGCASRM
jgi:hypothetical protein